MRHVQKHEEVVQSLPGWAWGWWVGMEGLAVESVIPMWKLTPGLGCAAYLPGRALAA